MSGSVLQSTLRLSAFKRKHSRDKAMERLGMQPVPGATRGLAGLPTPHRRRDIGDKSSGTVDNAFQFRSLISKVLISDRGDLLQVLTEVNQTLSTQAAPAIEPFVAADGVQAIIKKITEPQTCAIYLEAVRALSTVACGTSAQAKAIVNFNGVEAIGNLLRTESVGRPELCGQRLEALANVAGQSSSLRDALLDYEILDLLADLYAEVHHVSWLPHFSTQVVRSLTWLMSNLCQSQPPPPISKIVDAFDFFGVILATSDDLQTICEACMGLCHFFAASDSKEEKLDFIREMLVSWEVTGEDLQQLWSVIPGVARATRAAKHLLETGSPTPDLFMRLLTVARGWTPDAFSCLDEEDSAITKMQPTVAQNDGDNIYADKKHGEATCPDDGSTEASSPRTPQTMEDLQGMSIISFGGGYPAGREQLQISY